MKPFLFFTFSLLVLVPYAAPAGRAQSSPEDFEQQFESPYNTITISRKDNIVEMRARLNQQAREFLESAVNLDDPLRLVVPYTRTLFAGLFFEPNPRHVLIVGLGGGGFHRLFAYAHPDTILHTVELDPKVLELAQTYMGFRTFDRLPVTILDGREFIAHDDETWDWIILDAFRGGFVPPHLKTREFYEECAARLGDHGLLISNLHDGTKLFAADLKTLQSVFPQIVLFNTGGRGNVIACAVKYTTPDITDPANWTPVEQLNPRFAGRLNMSLIHDEHMAWPTAQVESAKVLTDDFNPVEMLNAIKTNNETRDPDADTSHKLPGYVLPAAGGGGVLLLVLLGWGALRRRRK